MKSLMSLYEQVLCDAGTWCCTSTIRDLSTVTERFEHEGLSFLTITLPNFGRDFESCLDQGFVSPTHFLGFKRRGCLPQFLGGFNDLVFDRRSGRILPFPNKLAIFYIRQLTLLFKKIKISCTEVRERRAYAGYVKCEYDVKEWSSSALPDKLESFRAMSRRVWSRLLTKIDRKIYRCEHVPKHGPGSTADKRQANRKFSIELWHSRLEESFPAADFVIPNYGFYADLDTLNIVEPLDEMPVKVISVPKTLKTPRLIAMEPSVMQYAQQSILELLVSYIEGDSRLQQCVGFLDQSPNQTLAKLGSVDQSLATIDLSEASDRVSNKLVELMFGDHYYLNNAIQACRSTRAKLPDGTIIDLQKFASMGSALCFPVMAMVILTVVCIGVQRSLNRSLTENDLKSLFGRVRIYGDDIIIPVEFVQSVVQSLADFGLKVNTNKSFWTGKFRESCGRDYYDGCDVTVTYVRSMFPEQQHHASEMVSTVSLRNQLYKAGLWKSCSYLDDLIRKFAKFPRVAETSPIIGRFSFLGYETQKTSPHLHSPLVFGPVVKIKKRPSELDGYPALMKYFLKRGLLPLDLEHLTYGGRPIAVNIKHRWASPF